MEGKVTRLELLALDLDLPRDWSVTRKADWLRDYLRAEIARVRQERAESTKGWEEIVSCHDCGTSVVVSWDRARKARERGTKIRCEACRSPQYTTPGPNEARWLASLDEATRESALRAVALIA